MGISYHFKQTYFKVMYTQYERYFIYEHITVCVTKLCALAFINRDEKKKSLIYVELLLFPPHNPEEYPSAMLNLNGISKKWRQQWLFASV